MGAGCPPPRRGAHPHKYLAPHSTSHPNHQAETTRRSSTPRCAPPVPGFVLSPSFFCLHRREGVPRHPPHGHGVQTSPPGATESQHSTPPEREASRLCSRHRLPSLWFRALFDSLFKVLFTFPSQYLYDIGLRRIFSLGRKPPPSFTLHSQATLLADCVCPAKLWPLLHRRAPRDCHPLWCGVLSPLVPVSKSHVQAMPSICRQSSPHISRHQSRQPRFRAGLSPVRSPLLGRSPLISSPPLNDMLKFGG